LSIRRLRLRTSDCPRGSVLVLRQHAYPGDARRRLLTSALAAVILALLLLPLPCAQYLAQASVPADTAPARVVAVGDLHGDYDATLRALRLAGAIDEHGHWSGGDLVLVQTGDILGRGDGEREVLEILLRLKEEAPATGGEVHILNGNHELMNVLFDFRYVSGGAKSVFDDFPGVPEALEEARAQGDSAILSLPADLQARAAAFRPGGPVARILADHPVAVRIGSTVFTHAGIRPVYAAVGPDELNRQCREWLMGEADAPGWTGARKGPTWSRDFSAEVDDDDCVMVARSLDILGAGRMVVAHTVHDAITSYCDDRIWCIDTGMSSAYGGDVQVLEIRGDDATPLSE